MQRQTQVRYGLQTRMAKYLLTKQPVNPFPLLCAEDHGVRTASLGRSYSNRGLYDDLRLDVFEGNTKHNWIDEQNGFCHLCQEATGLTTGIHLADREHVCLGLFLYLASLYPRTWSATEVLNNCVAQFMWLHRSSTTLMMTQDHLHTVPDAIRRGELESMLLFLSSEKSGALNYSLQGRCPLQLWTAGERIFKVNISRLVAMMLPPMAPGVHSTFCQKCWGRSNQERMYDALNVGRIHEGHNVEPKNTRDGKAFFMRSLLWELHTVQDTKKMDDVSDLMVDIFLRRVSYEMIFLQSMYYMNRVQELLKKMDFPTLKDLHDLHIT